MKYTYDDVEDVYFEELKVLINNSSKNIFKKSRTVGANPQDQSRLALDDHVETQNSKYVFSKTRAEVIISEARRDDNMLVFN